MNLINRSASVGHRGLCGLVESRFACHSSGCTASLVTLTYWWIWKQRNAVVFNNACPGLAGLLSTIKSEARLWVHAGEVGLGTVLCESPGE